MAEKKRISFVRHAKSSWSQPGLKDIDRPLNRRGIRDRELMATVVKKDFLIPALLLSSPAKRAFDTASTFAKTFGYDNADIMLEKNLYHASTDDFEDLIMGQDDSVQSLMIFSHNPGLTYMANDYSAEHIENVPTTGIFILESTSNKWVDFLKQCSLISIIYPKMYV